MTMGRIAERCRHKGLHHQGDSNSGASLSLAQRERKSSREMDALHMYHIHYSLVCSGNGET